MATNEVTPVAGKHPELVQKLEGLPEHIAEDLGSVALQMSHEAMFEKKEVQGSRSTFLVTDFERNITDPDYDSSELDVEAVEAARQGQDKLAQVLHDGSDALKDAHSSLAEEGMTFGAQGLETDEARTARETDERDAVYQRAFQKILDRTNAGKEMGDTEEVTKALEALILLGHVHSPNDADRESLRAAVKQGFANELLTALRTAKKLYTGKGLETVTSQLGDVRELLSNVTGREISDDFEPGNEVQTVYVTNMYRDVKHVMAALQAPGSALKPEVVFNGSHGGGSIELFAKNWNPQAAPGEPGSVQYFDELLQLDPRYDALGDAFKTEDPRYCLQAAEALGIPPWEVGAIFGQPVSEDFGAKLRVDPVDIQNMLTILQTHPEVGRELLANYSRYNFSYRASSLNTEHTINTTGLVANLDLISQDAASSPDLVQVAIWFSSNPAEFSQAIQAVQQSCNVRQISLADLNIIAGSFIDLRELLVAAGGDRQDLERKISDAVIKSQVKNAYVENITGLRPPITKQAEKLTADQMPELVSRMVAQGIPDDVAKSIIDSWTTYSSFRMYLYDHNLPDPVKPVDSDLAASIGRDQAFALDVMLKRFESFVETFGIEKTTEIIDTFGIYNFARHDPQKLIKQLDDWKAGVSVKSVVVDARSDWDSYMGGRTVFDEEVGEGVFYFEAASGTGAARVAVQVGRHERANGREPSVDRFIIHAHANNEALVMGPNREMINLQGYREAARKAQKINAQEGSDFRRHLGPDFQVILQGCSTAKERFGGPTITEALSQRHDTPAVGSADTITGVRIRADGVVVFQDAAGKVDTVEYSPS